MMLRYSMFNLESCTHLVILILIPLEEDVSDLLYFGLPLYGKVAGQTEMFKLFMFLNSQFASTTKPAHISAEFAQSICTS